MFIYKITNIVNGKIYIGQTINPVNERFKRHINDAINNILDTHFARAIRKYGPQSFICEIIDTAVTQEQLTYKEYFWINYFKSDIIGYNETNNMYKCGGNTYCNKTEEELKDISRKISESKIGKNNPNSKIVKCFSYNTYQELFFYTVDDCRKYFGEKNHRFISTRVARQTKSLYKDEWAIAYYFDSYYQNEKAIDIRRRSHSPYIITIVDLRLFEEKVYYSLDEAEEKSNIPMNIIKEAIKNSPIFYDRKRIIITNNKS